MGKDEGQKHSDDNRNHHIGGSDGMLGVDIRDIRGDAGMGGSGGFSVIPDADAWLLQHIIGCYVAWHAEMSVTNRISDAEKMVMAPIMDAANLMLLKLKNYGSTNQ